MPPGYTPIVGSNGPPNPSSAPRPIAFFRLLVSGMVRIVARHLWISLLVAVVIATGIVSLIVLLASSHHGTGSSIGHTTLGTSKDGPVSGVVSGETPHGSSSRSTSVGTISGATTKPSSANPYSGDSSVKGNTSNSDSEGSSSNLGGGSSSGSSSNSGSSCTGATGIPSGFPNNCNTGYANAPNYPGNLTTYSLASNGTNCSGPITSGTTYNFCNFPGGISVGSSSTAVNNVTFNGCWFHGTEVGNALVTVYGNNINFIYSTFSPGVSAPPVPYSDSYQYGIAANGGYYTHVGAMKVDHSDFWGFGNAIDTLGSTQANPQVFTNNYIHDASADGGGQYHTDGIGSESGSGTGSYVVINHNTIVSAGNTNGIAFQQGTYSNFSITNNYFSGFGYTVALWAPAPDTTFTGNVWGTNIQQAYTPLYPQSFWTSSGSVWRDNTVYFVPGSSVYYYGPGTGASSGLITAAQSGEFWTPNGISATDY